MIFFCIEDSEGSYCSVYLLLLLVQSFVICPNPRYLKQFFSGVFLCSLRTTQPMGTLPAGSSSDHEPSYGFSLRSTVRSPKAIDVSFLHILQFQLALESCTNFLHASHLVEIFTLYRTHWPTYADGRSLTERRLDVSL